MDFFNSAVDVLKMIVIALGGGMCLWGLVNLAEGYGNDNPGAKSQGIKQLIAGAGISAHNATATYTGNAKVLVKNVQSDNSAGAWIIADSSDYIVGGGVYSTNANSKENVSGNTEVVVDVPASATGDFVKNIVGGGMMPTGGSNRENPQCRVGGNSSVTISAPAAVTFTGNIYAGGFNAGGNGDVTVAGSATLTINGGSFSSTATLNGGVATGTKALVINQDMGFGSSRIIGFDAIAVGDGMTAALRQSLRWAGESWCWTAIRIRGRFPSRRDPSSRRRPLQLRRPTETRRSLPIPNRNLGTRSTPWTYVMRRRFISGKAGPMCFQTGRLLRCGAEMS